MLRKVFNGNNIFFRAMGRLGDFICLNIIYIFSCIPIITVGASTCALYDILYDISEGREGHCLVRFWDSFKRHFKRATIYWTLCLLITAFWGTGMCGVRIMNGSIQILFGAVTVILGIFWLGLTFFGLILVAWTELPVRTIVHNASLITLGSLPWLAVSVLITCIPAILILTMHIRIVAYVIPMLILFGIVLLDYMKVFVYKQTLKKYGLLVKENENGIE